MIFFSPNSHAAFYRIKFLLEWLTVAYTDQQFFVLFNIFLLL